MSPMEEGKNLFELVSNRLWQKLELHRDKICLSCACFKQPFLLDQMIRANPLIKKLIKESEEECDCRLNEDQAFLAVKKFIYSQGNK
jgi:hypothetical protein